MPREYKGFKIGNVRGGRQKNKPNYEVMINRSKMNEKIYNLKN